MQREHTKASGDCSLVEDEFVKLEAKNQVFQDKNCLFLRNGNNVETLPHTQLFISEETIFARFRAFALSYDIVLPLPLCIYQNMAGKNKNIKRKNGSHRYCDWHGKSNQSHYRGPP